MPQVIRRVAWLEIAEGLLLVGCLALSLSAAVWLAVHGGPSHF
ncbi:hypothetical protein [Streptomyces sp. UNOC14_S4]|nr:hypothetical protein [Streptomyces sp. UNOC14_S4]